MCTPHHLPDIHVPTGTVAAMPRKKPATPPPATIGDVSNIDATDELSSSFIDYAMSVIVSRALPDARDGLKPVHRRILYSMREAGLKPDSGYVKSARVVGNCFTAGTLIRTHTGLAPIETIRPGDTLLDGVGTPTHVTRTFTTGAEPLTRVSFTDGTHITVTQGQLFRTINPDTFEEQWTAATDLTPNDRVLVPATKITTPPTGHPPTTPEWDDRPGVPAHILTDRTTYPGYLTTLLDTATINRSEGTVLLHTDNPDIAADVHTMLVEMGISAAVNSNTVHTWGAAAARLLRATGHLPFHSAGWPLRGPGGTLLATSLLRSAGAPVTSDGTVTHTNIMHPPVLAAIQKANPDAARALLHILANYRTLEVASTTAAGTDITFDVEVDSDTHELVAAGVRAHNCMGRYHPHGDSAIYDAMVRMAQDFQMSVPLVDGHGNFGTLTDSAAASRYCIPGTTRVRKADGTSETIATLVGTSEPAEVPLNVDVTGARGETVHASRGFCSGTHPLLTAVTASGRTVSGTPNHPVATPQGWVKLEDLRPGTPLLFAPPLPLATSNPTPAPAGGILQRADVWQATPTQVFEWLTTTIASGTPTDGGVLVETPSISARDELLEIAAACARPSTVSETSDTPVFFPENTPWTGQDLVVAVVSDGHAPVFSLRVDTPEHAFCAGGFIHHNTEARMAPAAMLMTESLDENTVDMVDNYDGRLKEPVVLPAAYPNLLVNGTAGIAVGMSTLILPHNLADVTSAAVALLRNPDLSAADLADIIIAPDFPSGGVIYDAASVRTTYLTGRGKVVVGSAETIETDARGRASLIFTELPYQVAAEKVVERINDLIREDKLPEVVRVADLSDRTHGLRLVVDLRAGANIDRVRTYLYRHTPLRSTFHVHHLALIDSVPVTADVKTLLSAFTSHRVNVVRRRSTFRKEKAVARAHIVEGLLLALTDIDAVVATIRAAQDTAEARDALMARFALSEIQTAAVLEMPLRRLTSLEVSTLRGEAETLAETIATLDNILTHPSVLVDVVCDELVAAASELGSSRRTVVGTATVIDDVEGETLTGGVAVSGWVRLDTTGQLIVAENSTQATATAAAAHMQEAELLWVFTDNGHLVPVKTSLLPPAGQAAAVETVVDLDVSEKPVAILAGNTASPLCFVTAQGKMKRMNPDALPKRSAQVIRLDDGDHLLAVFPAPDDATILLASSGQMVLATPAAGIPVKGAAAGGVSGMRLPEGEKVIAAGVGPVVTTVADTCEVHSAAAEEIPTKGRGGGGVRVHKLRTSATTLTHGWVHGPHELFTSAARGRVSPAEVVLLPRGRVGSTPASPLWWCPGLSPE